MQLKRKASRRAGLAAATLSLLSVGQPPARAADSIEPADASAPWDFDTAVLLYSESDGRVQAAEPVLSVRHDLGNDRAFGVKLVLDTLTGASPNGATPASTPQTFSRPSGAASFTAAAGETPLDDTFHDTRVALSGDYLFPTGQSGKTTVGLSASSEFDFVSVGGNVQYSHDFNQKNTTLSAGLSFEADQIKPVGGAPEPMTVLPPPAPPGGEDEGEDEEGDDEGEGGAGATHSKFVTDAVFGFTQVLDANSLAQFNYSVSLSSGYQNDPYKLLSVVGVDGEPLRYVYENRPDSRTKHSLFARYKHFVAGRDVLDGSYRLMTDDWGVVSHTVEATYRWNFSDTRYLEPHLRWYTQSAADFYRVALYDGEEAQLGQASADPRLGAFTGVTGGLKYGQTLASGNQWSARLEYYRQVGAAEGVPAQAAAGLAKFDLGPQMSAVMATFGYRFKW